MSLNSFTCEKCKKESRRDRQDHRNPALCNECRSLLMESILTKELASQDAVGVKSPDVDGLANEICKFYKITENTVGFENYEISKKYWIEKINKSLSRVGYTTPKKITDIIRKVYKDTWSDKKEVGLFLEELKDQGVDLLEE